MSFGNVQSFSGKMRRRWCWIATFAPLLVSGRAFREIADTSVLGSPSDVSRGGNQEGKESRTKIKSRNRGKKVAGATQEAATLRRIKREWRDAVSMGIAYDWVNMEDISSSRVSVRESHQHIRIGPIGKHLRRWHFSVAGPEGSAFEGGVYHGRLLLPKDYPASPPRIQVFTPNGRFKPGMDICLSASSYHPESWTPIWTIRTLVEALRTHMVTEATEIGGMDATYEERRKLAKESRNWAEGGVEHRNMIQAGLFPSAGNEKISMSSSEADDREAMLSRDNLPKRRASVAEHIVLAAVNVLTSPRKLTILLFLIFFLLLNKQ